MQLEQQEPGADPGGGWIGWLATPLALCLSYFCANVCHAVLCYTSFLLDLGECLATLTIGYYNCGIWVQMAILGRADFKTF